MGICMGLAIVMQIITLHAPPVQFNVSSVTPTVARDCGDLPVHTVSKKRNRNATQTASWFVPPNIRICPHTNITTTRIRKAVNFWEILGYEFGDIHMASRDDYQCIISTPNLNEIIINIPDQDFKFGTHLGTTHIWHHTQTKEIIQAKIQIVDEWGTRERILEHEIGHALGWKDNNVSGHLMNKSWTGGGWNTTGLKNE